jgi:hypothetical protein
MYRDVFRKSHSQGLGPSRKFDILDVKADLKARPEGDTRTAEETAATSTLETSKHIRGTTESLVDVPHGSTRKMPGQQNTAAINKRRDAQISEIDTR